MRRKTAIRSSLLLVSLCGTLWAIPSAIEALEEGASKIDALDPGLGRDPFDPDAPQAPTVSHWLEKRGADGSELRIVGVADPGLSVEERIALLQEAHANAPAPTEKPD